ncbi:hypothetical protein ABZ848_19960 [Streptomyces sp. NPDC047081]|uniref:hypothetical protein n=1 Tax=Streptomyces sp. NPDC047081 TaxID=3154706 RepID=UPI0033C14E65
MEVLIASHMPAEEHGDPGIPAALERYEQLVKDMCVKRSQRTHTYYSDDAATVEDLTTAVVTGQSRHRSPADCNPPGARGCIDLRLRRVGATSPHEPAAAT